MNLPVSLNFVQNNDVSINLVTNVNFLRKVCPKSCIILQTPPLFILWSHYKKLVYFLEHLFIFIIDFLIPFATTKWANECLGTIERESKQEGGKIKKTNKRERGRGKRNIEDERRKF